MSIIELLWISVFLTLVSNGIINTTVQAKNPNQALYNATNPGMGYNYSFNMRH